MKSLTVTEQILAISPPSDDGRTLKFHRTNKGKEVLNLKLSHSHFHLEIPLIFIRDEEAYFKSLYECPNVQFKCFYTTTDKTNFERHLKSCEDPKTLREKLHCKQVEFGHRSYPFDKLRTLLDVEPTMNSFVFYDIETLVKKTEINIGKTDVVSHHHLLSIAANKVINGQHTTKCWVLEEDTKEAEQTLVDKFVDFIIQAKDEVRSPAVDDAQFELDCKREMLESEATPDKAEIKFVKDQQRILDQYKKFNVFGFNSSRYDLQILMHHILVSLEKKNQLKSASMLKKGTAYFQVHVGDLIFKDLMSFSVPTSLDNYMKTWLGYKAKEVYPYTHFQSLAEIKECRTFPPYEAFRTEMKGDVDMDQYIHTKNEFDRRMCLPSSDPERWNSFEDYLRFYNG